MNDPFRLLTRSCSDRRGFALIAVLVVMVVLGLIGGAALKLTAGDQKVTRLFADANQADAAAAAGLEHAIAVFQMDGAFPVDSIINGYSYNVTKAADLFDYDGDTVADTVYLASDGTYNEAGDGHVVFVLESTATKASFKAVQRIRVSKRTLSIEAPAALTSNSTSQLSGNITIDGRNHTVNGTLDSDNGHTGACDENKPSVTVTDSSKFVDKKSGAVSLNGHSDFASNTPAYTTKDETVVYVTPEDVLGLEAGDLDAVVQDADAYVPPDTLSGLIYIDGDYGSTGIEGTNTVNGTGILIVHNPLYNPREHDPADPMYDAAKASDARYAPANLGNINGGTFHGLIIADKIERINGNIDIIGAVVSLSEIDITLVGAGTAEILYSCSALTQAGNSSPLPPARLAWSAD